MNNTRGQKSHATVSLRNTNFPLPNREGEKVILVIIDIIVIQINLQPLVHYIDQTVVTFA
jgi:hypothetical protein